MATPTWETGLLLQEFPYIRIGNGPHNLLVVPGTQVDNVDPGFVVKQTYRAAYATFARDHTLYLVNRKRGLPTMYTSEDMAADYVRVLHAIGPSRVMGLSAGGLIAQHVALQAPALVEKLALVVCTHGAGADHPMFDAQVRALAPRFRSSCFVANRTGRGVDRGSGAPLSRVEPELPVCRHTRRRPLCE